MLNSSVRSKGKQIPSQSPRTPFPVDSAAYLALAMAALAKMHDSSVMVLVYLVLVATHFPRDERRE